jgi:hypothetical protein
MMFGGELQPEAGKKKIGEACEIKSPYWGFVYMHI